MRLYRLIFLFFSVVLFHAQRYTSQRYGMNEGLPQNSIKDIIKDKDGFLWMATDNGVLRYDGKGFLLYNDFKVKNVSFKDFFLYKNQIYSYNNNEENSILISDRTVKVLPPENTPKTIRIINNKEYKKYYKNSFINNLYYNIFCYFIETDSGSYFLNGKNISYKPKNGIEKVILPNFELRYLKHIFEHNNVVYIADPTNHQIIILNNGVVSYQKESSPYTDPKSKIYWHQGTKQVFVINNGNIYLSKVSNGVPKLTFLMQYKEIEKEFLYCMFYDEDTNKLYFGNVVKGVNVINLSNFYVPQKNIPFSGEVTYEALPFTNNSVITKQGFEYSKDTVRKLFPANMKFDRRFLLYDKSENILYVEFNKVQIKSKASQYKKTDSISFYRKNVQSIFKTDKNYILGLCDLTFKDYFLYVFADDKFKNLKSVFQFNKNSINFVKEYNDDLLYVGTSNGIYLLSLSKKKIVKHFAKDLIIKEIQSLDDGTFWFTTYNSGIYFLKNTEIIKMPNDKTGEISNAHHILEDSRGFLWISSNNGLFKVSKKMFLNYTRNRNSKVAYYRYTTQDGLLNNEFNGSSNPSGNVLKNGYFVFPSMEGFVFFKPEDIKTHYPKSNQLFIERAKNGKNKINFKDTLRLKSDYKAADIYFDFPYYHNIENIYVETKLENSEQTKWEDAKNDRKYILSNVGPGNYILHVRFLTSENGDFAEKKIYIEIEPFYYQTLWYKILVVILGVSLIILIIQVRTNFLKRTVKTLKTNLNSRNQELKETVDNLEIARNKFKIESEYQQKMMESISHDITTPVKFITLLSQKLTEVEDPLSQKKYFDGLYKASEQLYKFTLGLKGYSELYKEENIVEEDEYQLYEVIEEKRLLFEQMATSNETTIINLCPPEITVKANKNILSTILHNLIDNAVKYTKSGEIQIKVNVENDNEIEIGIFDTGKGMSQRQIEYYSEVCEKMETEDFVFKNYGLGLHMVIQLSRKINAKISFQNNKPTGTIVKIFLKTTNYE